MTGYDVSPIVPDCPIAHTEAGSAMNHSLLEETWRAIEEFLTKMEAEDCQAEYLRR